MNRLVVILSSCQAERVIQLIILELFIPRRVCSADLHDINNNNNNDDDDKDNDD